MQYSLDKYVPGLGKDFFIHPDCVGDTGGADKHIPGLGISVYVDSKHIDVRGGAEKYIPSLGKGFLINPKHVVDTTPVEPEPELPPEIEEP